MEFVKKMCDRNLANLSLTQVYIVQISYKIFPDGIHHTQHCDVQLLLLNLPHAIPDSAIFMFLWHFIGKVYFNNKLWTVGTVYSWYLFQFNLFCGSTLATMLCWFYTPRPAMAVLDTKDNIKPSLPGSF